MDKVQKPIIMSISNLYIYNRAGDPEVLGRPSCREDANGFLGAMDVLLRKKYLYKIRRNIFKILYLIEVFSCQSKLTEHLLISEINYNMHVGTQLSGSVRNASKFTVIIVRSNVDKGYKNADQLLKLTIFTPYFSSLYCEKF
jgi:hypothetical protein